MKLPFRPLGIHAIENGFGNAYRQVRPLSIPPFLVAEDEYTIYVNEGLSDCFCIDSPLLCHLLHRVMRLMGVPRIGGKPSGACIRLVIRAHMATVS